MKLFSRDELLDHLREHTCCVVFTKANGEKRRMNCTLRPDILQTQFGVREAEGSLSRNPETVVVLDLEKHDWRSFRVDSVEDVEWL